MKKNSFQFFLFFSIILIFLLFTHCQKSTPIQPQPNPSISASCSYGDTLEISIQLDKSWYEIPDTVNMTLEVKNISNDTINVEFFDLPGYNFAVYDSLKVKIWQMRYSSMPVYWIDTLSPDSSLIFSTSWNMENDSGEIVPAAKYLAVGWLGLFYPPFDAMSPYLSFTLIE